MRLRALLPLYGLLLLTACTRLPPPDMVTAFYDVTDGAFSIRAVAPADRIRELVVCKAAWFAEKRGAGSFSMGNPSRFAPADRPGWAELAATAYLTTPNPDHTRPIDVASLAAACRRAWPWYT